jgi:hypothetical protein
MSLTRLVAAAALAGVLTLAGACGGDSGDDPAGPSVDPTTAAADSPTPAPTTPTPTPTPTPRPTKSTPKATPSGGNGGVDDMHGPSTAGGGVCTHLSTTQVGAVLGVPVSGAAVPGETGCEFDQGGKRGMTVTVLDKSTAEAGGMAGAKAEANSAVEGEPQDVSGIGSAAFVVTGAMFGGPDVNAAGAVQVGNRIISVLLEQHSRLSAARMRSLETDLLKLVAHASR